MTKPNLKSTSNDRKMALQVICSKCKRKVDSKNTMLCSLCRNNFEFDCVGYSERLYRLKDAAAKKNWKCKDCSQKSKRTSTPYSALSHVTTRKNKTAKKSDESPSTSSALFMPTEIESSGMASASILSQLDESETMQASITQLNASPINQIGDSQALTSSHDSYEPDDSHVLTTSRDLSESAYSFHKPLSKSLDHTITDSMAVQEMKDTISRLQTEYTILQNEFENITLENNDLRQKIIKLTKENKTLTALCQSSHNVSQTIQSAEKGNRRSKPQSEVSSPLTSHYHTGFISPAYRKTAGTNNIPVALQLKIKDLEKQLKYTENQVICLKQYINTLEQKLTSALDNTQTPLQAKSTSLVCADKEDDKNRLYITGTQRCTGLATALIQSRANTPYEKYVITAITKPYAPSADFIVNIRNINVKPKDKVIICIGENDYDINILSSQLRRFLRYFPDNDTIVLNILTNIYLSVTDINKTIKRICNGHQNYHFVECKHRNPFQLCNSINYLIDCIDYENEYLNPKQLKKIIARSKPAPEKALSKVVQYLKGTIPYYFSRARSGANASISGSDANRQTRLTQSTLLHFFPKIDKPFFRASQ
ncbi:unnamed protein product [Parnassius mnemosyne]|uniref:Uncharacterized protein n=1 Tax=Parnassius mnemosyne TaxID=213953 RepID=A0AAV1LM69_9NEOP